MQERLKFSFKYFSIHLIVSLMIAIALGVLVFVFWYPAPFREMTGGLGLYKLIMGIDLICGPLLTFILASPNKKRNDFIADISLVVLLQVTALAYGLYSVAQARPVAVVYEYNRFRLVNAVNFDKTNVYDAKPEYQTLPWFGIQFVGLKQVESQEEKNANMQRFMTTGTEVAMWPEYWIEYDGVRNEVWENATPIPFLDSLSAEKKEKWESAIASTGKKISELRYHVMMTPMSNDWLVLVASDGGIMGYVNIKGY